MINNCTAALLRGLCIDLTGKPYVVVSQKAEDIIPSAAMKLELGSIKCEKSAADIIRKTYEDWKKSNVSSQDKVIIQLKIL